MENNESQRVKYAKLVKRLFGIMSIGQFIEMFITPRCFTELQVEGIREYLDKYTEIRQEIRTDWMSERQFIAFMDMDDLVRKCDRLLKDNRFNPSETSDQYEDEDPVFLMYLSRCKAKLELAKIECDLLCITSDSDDATHVSLAQIIHCLNGEIDVLTKFLNETILISEVKDIVRDFNNFISYIETNTEGVTLPNINVAEIKEKNDGILLIQI
jgi:hypothetical protein